MKTREKRKPAPVDDEEDRKPPAKKKCPEADGTNKIDVFAVELLATTIFGFLDVRELFAIAKTSMNLRTQIQHKHVVRSALMHGGHAKTSMERIVALVRRKAIWTPSALRLLSICNGKRCEHCNGDKVNMVNENLGVFLCWYGCIKGPFTKKVAMNKKWSPFLTHPRVASNSTYIFCKPFQDSTGAVAGPLIHVEHMTAIQRKEKKLDDVLAELDAINDQNARQAEEMIETLEGSSGDAKSRQAEKRQKREETKKHAIERKKKNVIGFLNRLKQELCKDWGKDEPEWTSFALNYHNERYISSSKSRMVRMDYRFVAHILEPYLTAPSKATKNEIPDILWQIKESFNTVWESNVHDLEFLYDSEDFDWTVKEILETHYPNLKHVQKLSQERLDLLRNGEDPLECFINYEFSDRLNQTMRTKIASTLTESEASAGMESLSEAIRPSPDRIGLFASRFWTGTFKNKTTRREGRAALQFCMDRFPALFRAAMDFLSSPQAKRFQDKDLKNIWFSSHAHKYLLKRDFDGLAKLFKEIEQDGFQQVELESDWTVSD